MKIIKLPTTFSPTRVMASPDVLRLRVTEYFSFLEDTGEPPTPPGLARARGFSNVSILSRTLATADAEPGTYLEESVDALLMACSYIEDWYVRQGLKEAIPTAFTRFLLSAYHNRSERTIQENTGGSKNDLTVSILGVSDQTRPTARLITTPEEGKQLREESERHRHETIDISHVEVLGIEQEASQHQETPLPERSTVSPSDHQTVSPSYGSTNQDPFADL